MSSSRLCLRLLQLNRCSRAFLHKTSSHLSTLPKSPSASITFFNSFSSQPVENVSPATNTEKVKVKFRVGDEVHTVDGKVGDSLLDVVVDNEVPLDGYGACEGTLACSTCHVVLSKTDYDALPNLPCDEELDMLDLAYGLSDTSRLGCQVILSKKMDGIEVNVPAGTYDARL